MPYEASEEALESLPVVGSVGNIDKGETWQLINDDIFGSEHRAKLGRFDLRMRDSCVYLSTKCSYETQSIALRDPESERANNFETGRARILRGVQVKRVRWEQSRVAPAVSATRRLARH